ncbi:ABC transporter substrate-binding protein [Paenibacillus hemerocallicola]|uniref:ABC transporter substrate-binding protein n=1 Tax=Paenibacillus hemerocallicola TaxID=1172614 RepID=A0A5C4TDJ7_9BACL|nr:ABC transporter substrate-binding protein [Paenibacillus hemerocallicola]TNJ66975.1 ABC transporter substrate-binding protein [Paenibacillus hemerocallicola]
MKRAYAWWRLAAALLALLVLGACGGNESPTGSAEAPADSGAASGGTKDKVLFIGTVSEPGTVNPINPIGGNVAYVINGIFNDALFDMDDSYSFSPKLAESMETTDNQTFVFKLNPKAAWNDGTPFTTEDVAFTLQTALHAKVDTYHNFNFLEGVNQAGKLEEGQTEISGLKIIDARTFSIRTKQPINRIVIQDRFAARLHFIPKHVLKDVAPEQMNVHPYFQNPNVTTGAFRFVAFKKGAYLEFARNEHYYRGIPKVDKVFVKIVPAANLVGQLETGELHMNSNGGVIPIADFDRLKSLNGLAVDVGEPSNANQLIFNVKAVPLKVRQAIPYALNRKMIVDKLFQGQAEIVDGVVPSNHPNYNSSQPTFEYNPEKAKQLLAESGWDMNRPLSFYVPTNDKGRELAAEIVAQNLQAVGLKVNLQKFDFATMLQKIKKVDYEMAIFSRSTTVDPSFYFSNWYNTGGGNNWFNYSNPEMDQLIAEGEREVDPIKQKAIYNKVQELLLRDLPTLGVYSAKDFMPVSKKVKVGKPKSFGMYNNIYEWDLSN